MLLAMIISVLAGVFFLIQPYLNDFEDNKDWTSANVIADKLQDRIDVVGSSSYETGVRMNVNLVSSHLNYVENAETWMMQADLYGNDRTYVNLLNESNLTIYSQNGTAHSLSVMNGNSITVHNIENSDLVQEFVLDQQLKNILIVDVFDENQNPIHRMVRLSLSGMSVITKMQNGNYEISLINGARIERMPESTWDILEHPRVMIDSLNDGKQRMSIMLTDIQSEGILPDGRNAIIEINSLGPMSLFDGDVRNFHFSIESNVHDIIAPQYIHSWTLDYQIHIATDSIDEYQGLGPWSRLSGMDGITMYPLETFTLEIGLQRVVLSK